MWPPQRLVLFMCAGLILEVVCGDAAAEGRRVICLDGTWQIAEGSLRQRPSAFDHRVPVPGLADMARPAFEAVGEEAGKRLRRAFWYRRTFELEGVVARVAKLKIHKAKFGTRVLLNGRLVGDHLPCFTPAVFDVRGALQGEGQTNELVVRVGAWRDAVPRSVPDGWDFEKTRYIPGIYDSVELLLCGTPHVVRVQTVPELERGAVRVVAVLGNAGQPSDARLRCRVCEVSSGRSVGSAESKPIRLEAGGERTVQLRVPIRPCRHWSPEDPFLYRLEATTGADTLQVRFGMRSFGFDPKTKMPVLNGKPYPLRGTNVCIYRFFEDPSRGDRPWREEWVRRLHRVFRGMHWNSARYCIGFPPERWYDIADEEGILIQDEFPIWYLSQWPAELKSDELVRQYTDWMQARWNHPCVVIWDAQNESKTAETGKAIAAVRGLDGSGRVWDNGWSPPQRAGDVFEAHPYPFYSKDKPSSFRLSRLADTPGAPGVAGGLGGNVFLNTADNPTIINEYGWLWLNRDGTPTSLSVHNYRALLGGDSSPEDRRRLYARYLAAMTEFWRCHRQVAGVLHFCGLGYSRPGGQTSDHFLDIEKLTLEPNFQRLVGDAFAPVGLMIDLWDEEIPAGKRLKVPVVVINDLNRRWEGQIRLRILRGRAMIAEQREACQVGPLGKAGRSFEITVPVQPGDYEIVAELRGGGRQAVQSRRAFRVP